MSAWNKYVKDNYHLVAHLPNKQRLKALSEMRNSETNGKATRGIKGGYLFGLLPELDGGALPTKGKKPAKPAKQRGKKKRVRGGDIVDDAYNTVKGYTSKGAQIADKVKSLADMANAVPDVARSGVRAIQQGYQKAKNVASDIVDNMESGLAQGLVEAVL